ncbi:PTS sugar transporter subunit IIA [Pediococcus acidilactici]|nr:PTS sugar transporter subunit IIA [Pediococcus acidilactici]UWF33673.1 PTS sugar transporter subunit IIA [Pediococcus acidilactici]
MYFDRKIIMLDTVVPDRVTAETLIATKLYTSNVVTTQFKDAVLKREQHFPTGLQTETVGVAIPHTDADKVLVPQIGFMRLKEPVIFKQMGDNADVSVKFIFMLALKKSEEQLTMLQNLMLLFQNQQVIKEIEQVSSKESFIALMKKNGIEK